MPPCTHQLRTHTFSLLEEKPAPTLTCVECDELATHRCHDCEENYCDSCFDAIHAKGRKKFHKWKRFTPGWPPCIECEERPATRTCDRCQDPYCDSCFQRTHAKVCAAPSQTTFCTVLCLRLLVSFFVLLPTRARARARVCVCVCVECVYSWCPSVSRCVPSMKQGKKKTHKFTLIREELVEGYEYCSQCKVLLGTEVCEECNKHFCDACKFNVRTTRLPLCYVVADPSPICAGLIASQFHKACDVAEKKNAEATNVVSAVCVRCSRPAMRYCEDVRACARIAAHHRLSWQFACLWFSPCSVCVCVCVCVCGLPMSCVCCWTYRCCVL